VFDHHVDGPSEIETQRRGSTHRVRCPLG
jgi:hypothetical protein